MADVFDAAIIQALQNKRTAYEAQNPLLGAGRALSSVNLYNPDASGWENAAIAALSGFTGGAMTGVGQQMVDSNVGDFSTRVADALKGGNPSEAFRADQELSEFAPLIDAQTRQRQIARGEAEEQFKQSLGMEVFKDRIAGARDLTQNQLGIERDASKADIDLRKSKELEEFKAGVETRSPVKQEQALTDLRKEFQGLPEIADFRQSQIGFRSLEKAMQDKTGTSDLELVRGAVQAIEPGMAVREGEQAAVQNSGAIPDAWRGALNKALTGGTGLSNEVREGIFRIAQRRINSYSEQAEMARRFYEGQATRRGLPDPKAVTYLGEIEATTRSTSPGVPANNVPGNAQTKVLNGVTYEKVDGGWRAKR